MSDAEPSGLIEIPHTKMVLEEAKESIRLHRHREFVVGDLEPGRKYTCKQISHAFPFGVAIRGQVPAQLTGGGDFSDRYMDPDYARHYVESLGGFNGYVERNAFKWPGARESTQKQIYDWMKQSPHFSRSRGHTVFWNNKANIPEELRIANNEVIARALFYDRLPIMDRFPFPAWDLVNEPFRTDRVFDPCADLGLFVRLFKEARQIAPMSN